MGERLLCKQEVIGSIPFTSTTGRNVVATSRQALPEQRQKRGVMCRWCATFGEAEETPSGGTGRRC